MIYDLSGIDASTVFYHDVCIIGSGPAGTTVAKELSGSGLKTCILESGSFKPDKFTDKLRDLDAEGLRIKDYSRERIVGGTSSTWAGLSSPLDPIDLERREWVAYSGWPIRYADIIPYYKRASDTFGFPSWGLFHDKEWMPLPANAKTLIDWQYLREKIFIAPENPYNIADLHRSIFHHHSTDLFVNATVTHFEGSSGSGSAHDAIARNPAMRKFHFKAKIYVLAGGGIENPRLLLNSTFAHQWGLGNNKDQVGRYFMNHPKNNYGVVQVRDTVKDIPGYFGFLSYQDAYAAYIGLQLKEAHQKKHGLLNSYVRFEPVFYWSGRKSIQHLLYFVKRSPWLMKIPGFFSKEPMLALRDYGETGDDSDFSPQRKGLGKKVRMAGSIVKDLPMVMTYIYNRLFERNAPKRKTIYLRNFMEMEPMPHNRVTLSNRKDVFGMPLPHIRHTPSVLDKKSMAAVQQHLDLELKKAGLGRLLQILTPETNPWPVNYDSSHYMGGTRMGNDDATSVVDKNCKLHHVKNVYLAGASVFPTSGVANPTYTIVALAIRLADHIKANKNLVTGEDMARVAV